MTESLACSIRRCLPHSERHEKRSVGFERLRTKSESARELRFVQQSLTPGVMVMLMSSRLVLAVMVLCLSIGCVQKKYVGTELGTDNPAVCEIKDPLAECHFSFENGVKIDLLVSEFNSKSYSVTGELFLEKVSGPWSHIKKGTVNLLLVNDGVIYDNIAISLTDVAIGTGVPFRRSFDSDKKLQGVAAGFNFIVTDQ